MKHKLCEGLSLKIPNPGKPFIIRTDASDKAVGGVLEQMDEGQNFPPDGVDKIKSFPIAFFSRKLTENQRRTWPVREKEAYAIVSILKKYASLIGLQPVIILTDHKSLENWTTEVLDAPGGPTGRKARWHILLSKFKLSVVYIKGVDNSLADCMSRWAYPAGNGEDLFFDGTAEDSAKVAKFIEQENSKEVGVYFFSQDTSKNCPMALDLFSGQGSWKDVFIQKGYDVVSLDWDSKNQADIQKDILRWEFWEDFEPGTFEIISASVPCEHYSLARTTSPRNISYANKIVKKGFANH